MNKKLMNKKKAITVIGMGNPLLGDDSVGLLIVDDLIKAHAKTLHEVDFQKNYSGGMDLLDNLIDKEKAVIVDCIKTGSKPPGYCHEFTIEDIEEITQPRIADAHSLDLLTVLEMGERCGFSIPKEIIIYGIEGTEFLEFCEKPTPAVKRGIQRTVEKITEKLYTWNIE